MHPIFESIRLAVLAGLDEASLWVAKKLDRRKLAWWGLGLAAVTLLSVNLFSASALRNTKADLTQDGLFTTSEGTRKALRAIDEPIDVRVYFSKRLGEAAPNFAKSFERLRALLDQYRDISGSKLQVTYIDPEPFSEAEDRAVASGLRGIRLNPEGEQGYFGLVAANTTDNEANIPFFAAERDRFIEYDVTKLIYSLSNPKKKVMGLISSLPIDGGMMPPMGMMAQRPQQIPPQMIMEQIREVFEVRSIPADAKEIPADIGVLMLVEPDLTPASAYAIDQFVLKGGKVLAFVDANSEMAKLLGPMMAHLGQRSPEFDKLLKSWGVTADVSKVAADMSYARRVQFGGRGQQGVVTDYVAWLTMDKGALDQKDVLSGGIDKLNLATAAALTKADGATTTLTPILQTSEKAMLVPTEKVAGTPDAVSLLRSYKPEGKRLTLAARLSGDTKSAFPDGEPQPPKKDEAKDGKDTKAEDKPSETKPTEKSAEPAKPAKPHVASGKINVTVIGDTDLLTDQFWVDVREFLGQQIAVPNAQNSAFVLAALENLSGSDALIALRGRGISDRPFERVNALRRDAEKQFREKEQALTAKLKDVTEQLSKIEKATESGEVVLSDKDKAAVEKFRAEMVSTRKELRDVKLALRQDIDKLDGWLKFLNIAALPLLIGVAGIGWAVRRRRPQPRA
jgi:ABC-type uncharacterized transport system involved in gliding motility auxiliary subunit